ncbi:NAD(P)-binding protein [Teratosphaeria nubilosa]|uniref:NAD(P)-binding protein n=1 Tax=Teratosphaeria nubilosa TaxID=161662 RepID=A0A6G1KU69_9PEZI|nr:NAD(P)-binding protein [Teratosphaeria nubilosa]
MSSFNPLQALPDLSDKVILVTGGTAGLGQEVICQLAAHGTPRILFTGRNARSAEETIERAKSVGGAQISFVACDMTELKSSAEAGERIARDTDRLDWVFCNAGIMAAPPALSKDGWEIQFAVNHLGHAMLLRKLMPTLERTAKTGADVRVVFTTSLGFKFARTIAFDTLSTKQEALILGAFRRYGQSKLANILYPAELAQRYPEITFLSIHPGVIKTGIITGLSGFNRYFTELTTYGSQVTVEEGVRNQLWAASAEKSKIANGEYYEPVDKDL